MEEQYQREGYDLKSSPPTVRFTEESVFIDFKSSIPGWYISMEPFTPEVKERQVEINRGNISIFRLQKTPLISTKLWAAQKE